jgi:hypothetical protein
MITIAGHLYTAAQVHAFLKGAAIFAGFLLFSYLALVTVPKMLAPSPTSVVRFPSFHSLNSRLD